MLLHDASWRPMNSTIDNNMTNSNDLGQPLTAQARNTSRHRGFWQFTDYLPSKHATAEGAWYRPRGVALILALLLAVHSFYGFTTMVFIHNVPKFPVKTQAVTAVALDQLQHNDTAAIDYFNPAVTMAATGLTKEQQAEMPEHHHSHHHHDDKPVQPEDCCADTAKYLPKYYRLGRTHPDERDDVPRRACVVRADHRRHHGSWYKRHSKCDDAFMHEDGSRRSKSETWDWRLDHEDALSASFDYAWHLE